jgi:sigma-B regulation protein RsbU (phosphoserine phosphatase)
MASGDLDAPFPVAKGRDEIARLTESFTIMRAELKAYMAQLRETVAAKERVESELRIAHDIQMSLVPRTFPPFPKRQDLELYALIEPAREVGGDFYDFFMPDPGHLCLAIGDVSGKGMPAALFMAVTRSFLRSFFHDDQNPAATMARLNDELSRDNEACMFVTLFCAVVDLTTGECRFASGGHNPPMLMDADGVVVEVPKLDGVAVGAIEDVRYGEGVLTMHSGQVLFMYTDGVTEAMNPADQLYGEKRMSEVLAANKGQDSATIITGIREDLRRFVDGADQFDDITMLAFRFFGPAGSGQTG